MADLFIKVNCTYCQEEINGVGVKCAECVDFDICLQCFSSGAEIGPHKNDHSYSLVDHCAVSLFGGKGNWTGREELQLLDAMELFGFENWDCVSRHMKTRTPEEVKEAYISRYFDGTIGKVTWNEIGDCRPVLPEHTQQDRGPLSPEVTSKLPPLDATPEEARQLGYMSHRDDFEREYDAEAEQLVSSLQLKMNEDSDIENVLKLAQIDMYTRRLRERCRRKRLVRDYQLVAEFFSNQRKDSMKKALTKEQKDLRDNMRVFSQFLTSGEHSRLIASIERERELRHRLSELLRYRGLGLTSQEEIVHYEQHAACQRQQTKAGSSGFGLAMQESQSETEKNEFERKCITDDSMELETGEDGGDDHNSSNLANSSQSDNIQCTSSNNTLPLGTIQSTHDTQLCTSLNLQPLQYRPLKPSYRTTTYYPMVKFE